jgi:hypothetical protein
MVKEGTSLAYFGGCLGVNLGVLWGTHQPDGPIGLLHIAVHVHANATTRPPAHAVRARCVRGGHALSTRVPIENRASTRRVPVEYPRVPLSTPVSTLEYP